MHNFDHIVKHWGDFGTDGNWKARFGGMKEGALNGRAENFEGGGIATEEREPGFGRIATRKMIERWGRKAYERRMTEAARMIYRGFNGSRRDLLTLQEAMSTSDFPNLFGDVIDRAVLANYLETPYTWNQIAYERTVNDFKPVRDFRIDGGTGLLGPTQASGGVLSTGQPLPLTQGAQYPEDSLSDNAYT